MLIIDGFCCKIIFIKHCVCEYLVAIKRIETLVGSCEQLTRMLASLRVLEICRTFRMVSVWVAGNIEQRETSG